MSKILVVTATMGLRSSIKRTIESVRTIGEEYVRHIIICPRESMTRVKELCGNVECIPEPIGCKGIYSALNYAFQTYGRDYDFLTFINDDDYWLPLFREMIKNVIENKNIDLVYGKTLYVNELGVEMGRQTCSSQFYDFVELLSSDIVLFTQQATLLKSTLYFDIGGFDTSYKLIADTKFWALLSMKRIRYLYYDKFVAAYTIQQGQLSSDMGTKKKEYDKLRIELNLDKISNWKSVLRFRINNFSVYVTRVFKKKKLFDCWRNN